MRLGQRYSEPAISGACSQVAMAFRVPSVISKLTRLRVLLEVRCLTYPAAWTSAILSLTRLHPHDLLSMARLNSQLENPLHDLEAKPARPCAASD